MEKIKIDSEIVSGTHTDFDIDCLPTLEITKDSQQFCLKSEFDSTSSDYILEGMLFIDAFLVAFCIYNSGVFSRVLWNINPSPRGIFMKPMPNPSPPIRGGVIVSTVLQVDKSIISEYINAQKKILNKVNKDDQAYLILIYYTTANWLFNAGLIKEAAINYFSVVEAIASTFLSSLYPGKTSYQKRDIHKAMKKMEIGATSNKIIIDNAWDKRGDLSHGNPKGDANLKLTIEHSLGYNYIVTYQIKLPALDCKAAADIFMRKYFDL